MCNIIGEETPKGLRENGKIKEKTSSFSAMSTGTIWQRGIFEIIRKFVIASVWPGFHTDK